MGRSKHRSKKQALKSLSALQQEDAYEQEIQSTEAGRRSHELRAQAGRLQGHGDLLGAHELYAEAASLFPLEDLGAAAASAFYDLGESYKKVASRRSLEDLLESKRLLQQTLRSPSRQRVPIRMAASHDALAQTLRRLTDLQASPEQRHERLKEAIDHHDQACALAEGCDIVGLESAASYHLNRGNAYDELGDLGAALAAYRRARALADRTLRIANATVGSGFVTKPQLPQHIRVAMMSVLLRRGRKTDLDEALRLASEAIDGADPSFAATAHLLAARILAKNAAHRRTELSRHLEAIDPRDLGFEHWRAYIDILAETGDSQNAVAMARHAVVRALRERKGALADHVADRCAEKAQRFAVREAEIHVDEGRAIDAFLALSRTPRGSATSIPSSSSSGGPGHPSFACSGARRSSAIPWPCRWTTSPLGSPSSAPIDRARCSSVSCGSSSWPRRCQA